MVSVNIVVTKKRPTALSRAAGLTLIEIVVTLAVLMTVAMGVAYVNIMSAQTRRTNTARLAAENLRYLLESNVKGSISWRLTTQANKAGTMACLDSGTSCDIALRSTLSDFKLCLIKADSTCNLYDANEVTAQGHAGLNSLGQICHGYSSTTPSDECPFHYDLKWQPICPPTGDCTYPGIRVVGTLAYDPAVKKYPLNSGQFSFDVVRPPPPNVLANICIASGGVFDANLSFCRISSLNGGAEKFCPVGQKIVSFDANGNLNCQPIYSGLCPDGKVIGAVAADGTISCVTNPCPFSETYCQGAWSACSGGTETFMVTTVAQGGGAQCPVAAGTQISCTTNVDCVGAWTDCQNAQRTYVVFVPANGAGASCPFVHGTTQACSDCIGSWSACVGGTQTFTVTTPASNGGSQCPWKTGDVRTCLQSQVGSLCVIGNILGIDIKVPCP